MGKIRLTKGELKNRRDALGQYLRYLPTLQLKKQQLQMEILHQVSALEEKKRAQAVKFADVKKWAGLMVNLTMNIRLWTAPLAVTTDVRNIAGVDMPVFVRAIFNESDYDLYVTPFWLDNAVESLKVLASLGQEIRVIERGIAILREELRITTQRVNLFEKVKIPEAREAIRKIKIYIGDQMTNAVGRSKIAKKKIEFAELQAESL